MLSTAWQSDAVRSGHAYAGLKFMAPGRLSLIRVRCQAAAVGNGQMREPPELAYTLALTWTAKVWYAELHLVA